MVSSRDQNGLDNNNRQFLVYGGLRSFPQNRWVGDILLHKNVRKAYSLLAVQLASRATVLVLYGILVFCVVGMMRDGA